MTNTQTQKINIKHEAILRLNKIKEANKIWVTTYHNAMKEHGIRAVVVMPEGLKR